MCSLLPNTAVPLEPKDPMPFSPVQAVETSQSCHHGPDRHAIHGFILWYGRERRLNISAKELQFCKRNCSTRSREISRREAVLRTCQTVWSSVCARFFFEVASVDIKSSSQPAFSRIVALLVEEVDRLVRKVTAVGKAEMGCRFGKSFRLFRESLASLFGITAAASVRSGRGRV